MTRCPAILLFRPAPAHDPLHLSSSRPWPPAHRRRQGLPAKGTPHHQHAPRPGTQAPPQARHHLPSDVLAAARNPSAGLRPPTGHHCWAVRYQPGPDPPRRTRPAAPAHHAPQPRLPSRAKPRDRTYRHRHDPPTQETPRHRRWAALHHPGLGPPCGTRPAAPGHRGRRPRLPSPARLHDRTPRPRHDLPTQGTPRHQHVPRPGTQAPPRNPPPQRPSERQAPPQAQHHEPPATRTPPPGHDPHPERPEVHPIPASHQRRPRRPNHQAWTLCFAQC